MKGPYLMKDQIKATFTKWLSTKYHHVLSRNRNTVCICMMSKLGLYEMHLSHLFGPFYKMQDADSIYLAYGIF